jgi:hypothetical protein
MKELFKKILDEMKVKVMTNLEQAKEQESDIRKLLSSPETFEKAFNMQKKFERTREILSENHDYLELQMKIVKLIDKYRNTGFMNTPFTPSPEKKVDIDYFTETIDGRMIFNEYHPYYLDEIFINDLISYFLAKENYKECQRLIELKNKITARK